MPFLSRLRAPRRFFDLLFARNERGDSSVDLHIVTRPNQPLEAMRLKIATEDDVPSLLGMMEPFNALEQIAWNATSAESALRNLLKDRALGLAALLEAERGLLGYFVLTWGFDLEWNGRDAFLTELFLVPDVRGKALGATALGMVEELARQNGARALHLMVRNENTVARRLYARGGYLSPPRIFLSKELSRSQR